METSCLKNKNVADAFQALLEITNIEMKKNTIKKTYSKIYITKNEHMKKEINKDKKSKC